MMGLLVATIGFGAASSGALPSFFVSTSVSAGFDVGTAGYILAAGSVLGLLVRLVAGLWADRLPKWRATGLVGMFLLGAVGYVLLAAGGKVGILLGGFFAFGAGSGWSGLFVLIVVASNPDRPAIASGISQTGGYAGAALGPLLFGLLANDSGFSTAWLLMAVLAIFAGLSAAAFARRTA